MNRALAIAGAFAACVATAHAEPPALGSEDARIMAPFKAYVEGQHSASGTYCCTIGDGRPVEAKIVGNHWEIYVTAEKFKGSTTGWREVPDSVVLHNANPTGFPIAWVMADTIFCFAPSGGV